MTDGTANSGDGALPVVSIAAGEYVFRAGDAADSFFVVSSGQIELLDGAREPRRLALLAERDLCGEDSAFGGTPRTCDARAITAAVLVRVTTTSFLDLVRVRPELASALIAWAAANLQRARIARVTMAMPAAGAVRGGTGPRFIHVESGTQFPLPDTDEVLVGRADPATKFQPGVELSNVDAHRSLSRRHAVVKRAGAAYQVLERGHVANGTFVNGKRLTEGVAAPIKDGDEVTFGLITTVFRTT